jgi:hypothetical protein
MERNNLDLAMRITDAILNEFEKNGKLDVPLDEHKYSFDLQDVIQSELEKYDFFIKENGRIRNERI